MNTKYLKKLIVSSFLALFCLQNIFAEDIKIKISETTMNSIAAAIIESKYLSYGTSVSDSYITYYSFKPTSFTLNVNPGNDFTITLGFNAVANFNAGLFTFDYPLDNKSITIAGTIVLQQLSPGYKITFVPDVDRIDYNGGGFLGAIINIFKADIINKLSEISTSSNQPLLPSIAESYFTSGTPTLTTTSTEIILELTTTGPKLITIQNEVNQRVDLGKVQEVLNNYIVGDYDSPKYYDLNTDLPPYDVPMFSLVFPLQALASRS